MSRDELDILEALIESNRQRQKTNEQVGREYEALKRIYHDRDSRQGQRQKTNIEVGAEAVKLFDDLSKEKATSSNWLLEVAPNEKAASALGVSRPTADKAAAVVKAIDKLKDSGQAHEAERLTRSLNTNVKKAHEFAQHQGYIAPPPNPEPKAEPKTAKFITLDQWNG